MTRGLVEAVDPARARRMLGDQTCVLQHLQVLGHGRSADGQMGGQLAHGLGPFAQAQDDRSPGAVPERRPHHVLWVSCH